MKYFIALLFIIIFSNISYSRNDTLYFCEEYKNGQEIGNSSHFYISKNGGLITVMLWVRKPLNCYKVRILVGKAINNDVNNLEPMSEDYFDVQPDWYYVHFDDIRLAEEGTFIVGLYKDTGEIVAANWVFAIYK